MAETNAKKKRIYGVKDIVNISGLNRNAIFYWSKTLEEIQPEYTTPGRQLFTFRSLLDFCLIAELQKMGLSPKHIRAVVLIEEDVDTEVGSFSQRFPIWDIFLKDQSKYEHEGYYLISRESAIGSPGRDRGSYIEYFVGNANAVENVMLHGMALDPLKMKSSILVNLLRIIQEVEEATGERLE